MPYFMFFLSGLALGFGRHDRRAFLLYVLFLTLAIATALYRVPVPPILESVQSL
jgi:hypothetical protein